MADKQVRDFMTPNPACVSETDSVRDVAQIMAREDTGVVPVVDGRKIIGMITDRDIVVRLVAQGKNAASAHVDEAMSKQVRSVREDASVRNALDLMSNAQIRRLPVVDGNDELVGIVSIGDIASDTRQADQIGHAIEEISEAPPNN